MEPREAYKRVHTTVPGWFHAVDLAVFEAVDATQRAAAISGAALEIGAYQGASAILLGFLVDRSADLVVCDLFESSTDGLDHANVAENDAHYRDLAQHAFEANYLRFHAELPDVRRCSSTALRPDALDPMRIVHVDGSHLYDFVRADLELSREVLVPGGVVIIDDYRSEHAPGPGAATWEAVARDGLVPLCITPYKFYGMWAPHELRGALCAHLRENPSLLVESIEVGPHAFCRAMAPPDLFSTHLQRQRRLRRYLPPVVFDATRGMRRKLSRAR